ncbi:hypothetical protein IW261DRAFT_1420064 [Armillaria novae-zelandiae]|uniref:Uncharacterized protein n=1 Tax=Armillaria novae-zelandiae TaxID=153914 RepID=A0AA39P8R6_9AGAR|nr:hypothetical protein IW261DRAFT_1420064 [Armillaria novae-zelandiae]
MSTEALQFENAYSEILQGYSVAKQSSLVWLLPVLCRQFLTTPLDPEKWIQMQAVTSDQDREILEFGKAMGRTLKFVTDESWSKGDPPKDSINFILPVRGTHKSANHLDTLVLVKAMDIATGFLRLPTQSYYPSFGKVIKLENSHIGYLKRLNDWPRKLEQIQTSFRMYSERMSIPLLAVVPGRDEGEVILHNDHESAKSWLKALCVLDGVTFHIWVLCFNNSPLAPWSGTDIIVEKHPDIQMIMANNDTLKKFKENLPRWKQVFANAVAILPLVLILGKGISQMLNTSQALQLFYKIGGRLSSLGKPDLLLRIEELLWRCIIGIAWGSWTSDVRIKRFLEQVQPLLAKIQHMENETEKERLGREWNDRVWFLEALSFALQNPIPGLESKAGIHTCQWLQSTEDKWMASLVRTKGRGASFLIALDPHFQGSLATMFARVQRWGHKNFCDFLDEKTGKEPWRLPAATAPLTIVTTAYIPDVTRRETGLRTKPKPGLSYSWYLTG